MMFYLAHYVLRQVHMMAGDTGQFVYAITQ